MYLLVSIPCSGEEAWETALGAVAATYGGGFAFRTPEAWDAEGEDFYLGGARRAGVTAGEEL